MEQLNNNINWCIECKDSITPTSNYVYKNGLYYHLFCYLQKLGITLPLNFDEAIYIPEDDIV